MRRGKNYVNGCRVFSQRAKAKGFNPSKLIVVDIETWGKNATAEAFALGVVYENGIFTRYTDIDELRERLLSPKNVGKYVFAHNGGGYDYLAIFGKLQTTLSALYRDSKFISGYYPLKRHHRKSKTGEEKEYTDGVHFYDSYNVLPVSLHDIGEALELPKGLTPIKFIKATHEPLEEIDFVYCENDCRVLYEGLKRFYEFTGKILPTIASSALYVFQSQYQGEVYYVPEWLDYIFRDSYFGGIVEAYFIGKIEKDNYIYDINSLYPSVMRDNRFPNPSKLTTHPKPSPETLMDLLNGDYEGCAKMTVYHNPSFIGYIPVKQDNKLLFKADCEMTGTWNFPEIRHALTSNKIEIRAVEKIVYSEGMESPFKGYVTDLYNRRMTTKNEYEKYIYKILLNSLYGKFGEQRTNEQVYAEERTEERENQLRKEHPDSKITWNPIDIKANDGYFKIENSFEESITSHTVFAFASYVTSHARVKNHSYQEMIYEHGGTCYYTDTDSFCTDIILPSTKELGGIKLEAEFISEIYGNKDYVKICPKITATYLGIELNRQIVKIKGVPKEHSRVMVDGLEKFSFTAIYKEKDAIRHRRTPGSPKPVTKYLRRVYDKRTVTDSGFTLALTV